MTMTRHTEFFTEVSRNFYAGFFNRTLVLSELPQSSLTDLEKIELKSIRLCAKACLTQALSEEESEDINETFLTILTYIRFTQTKDENEKTKLLSFMTESLATKTPRERFLASSALCFEGSGFKPLMALRLSRESSLDLSILHIMQLCLFDLWRKAQEALRCLTEKNDDFVILQMACAAVHIGAGNYQQAFSAYCDIEDECLANEDLEQETSVLMLNGKAVCTMMQRDWEEASIFLDEAHIKDPQNEDTLHNCVTCFSWLKNSDKVEMFLMALQEANPQHPLVTKLNELDEAFQSFSP